MTGYHLTICQDPFIPLGEERCYVRTQHNGCMREGNSPMVESMVVAMIYHTFSLKECSLNNNCRNIFRVLVQDLLDWLSSYFTQDWHLTTQIFITQTQKVVNDKCWKKNHDFKIIHRLDKKNNLEKKKHLKVNQEKAIRRNLGQSSNENVPCKVENYGECVNHWQWRRVY